MNLSKPKREALRMMFGGKCAYCGAVLPEKGWHADHVEPVLREWWKTKEWQRRHKIVTEYDHETKTFSSREATPEELKPKLERPENDVLANHFPSCRACNIDKHCNTLEGWRRQMQDRVAVCRRNYSAFRHAERFGLVKETGIAVVFWFEKFVAQGKNN